MKKYSIEDKGNLNNVKHVLKIMRTTLLLLFFSIMFSSASNIFSQGFTIKPGTTSIKEACEEIERNSDYIFVFSDNCEKVLGKKVNVDADTNDVAEVLDAILSSTGLTYRIIDKQIVVYESTESTPAINAEQSDIQDIQQPVKKRITGKVVDEQGKAIIGANIIETGTTNGTVTDVDGNFSLQVANDATIRITFIGYLEKSIATAGQSAFNVILVEDTKALEELVVIGYGTLEKNRMTTSVSSLDNMALRNPAMGNVGSALSGAIPGLSVTNTSGQPGSEPWFVLRGGTSWEGTGAPLFIIDGAVGTLKGLNADDIESLDVLKDAASTSIYGARAANGVVLITTKKGKPGDMEISYQYRYGVEVPRYGYDRLNAEDYIRIYRNAWRDYYYLTGRTNNLGNIVKASSAYGTANTIDQSTYTTMYLTPENEYLLNEGYKKMKDPLYGEKIGSYVFDKEYIIFQDNDMTRLFLKNGNINDHHLSFKGGNDRATYALGLGFLDNKGIVLKARYKRVSANLNSDFKITENVKLSSTVAYSNTNAYEPFLRSSGNIFQRIAAQPPTSRLYNMDGSLNPGLSTSFGNPLYWADKYNGANEEQRLRTNVALDWSILPELSFTATGSYSTTHNVDETFNKAYITMGT